MNCQKKLLLVLAVGSSGSSSGGSSSSEVSRGGTSTQKDNTASILNRLQPIQGATKDGVQVWKDSQTGKRYTMQGNGEDLTIVEL